MIGQMMSSIKRNTDLLDQDINNNHDHRGHMRQRYCEAGIEYADGTKTGMPGLE